MVGTFTIAQPTASALARSRLEEVHTEVRECLYVPNKPTPREGSNKASLMPISLAIDNPDTQGEGGLTTSGNNPTSRVANRPTKVDTTVQRSLPAHVAERYSQLLELMDKVAKGLRLVSLLSVKSIQPGATEPSSGTGDLRLHHDQIYAKDPFSFMDVLDAFLSNLPAFIESAGKAKARETVEKIVVFDGLLRNVCGHLDTSVNSELPSATQDSMSMTCLQVLEQVFTLLKDFATIR